MTTDLVTTDRLASRLGKPGLSVIDASWYLPAMKRSARDEYRAAHIPGAIFLDIDAVSDQGSDLPHMMPALDAFAAVLAAEGVSETDQIVVYDGTGIFSAARMWWMIRMLGHRDVAVLDGGMKKWLTEGREVTSDVSSPSNSTFSVRPALALSATWQQVQARLEAGEMVLDARSAGRFDGSVAEPRPGLKSGHMPGAKNLPFGELLNADGTMKSAADLRHVFAARGWTPGVQVTTSCGSGVTAAIISLALAVLGEETTLYDGSWAEWGGLPGVEIATGSH
ncbi:MAG: sulfurtransferase [Deltaproteobacteria bacterium]